MRLISSIIAILTSAVLFSSCQTVYFTQPQPAGSSVLSQFPEEVIGTWNTEEEGDKLVVSSNRFVVGENSDFEVKGVLNQNSILKKSNDIYYLSNLDSDIGYWNVVSFKVVGDSLLTYNIDVSGEQQKKEILSLSFCKPIKAENGDITAYLLAPDEKEFALVSELDLFRRSGAFARSSK